MTIKLKEPTYNIKELFNNYISEWQQSGEKIIPASIDPKGKDFKAWLDNCIAEKEIETCPLGLVPADTYFLIDDEKIIGAINIRKSLNDFLIRRGGNIGYGIRPSERKKGYATTLLKLGLDKCQELGMQKVLISCDKDNAGSAKVILANGGVFENEVEDEDRITQRYWINL